MRLKQLKGFLAHYPEDLDEIEVMLMSIDPNDEKLRTFDILCSISYSETVPSVLLSGQKMTDKLLKDGTPRLKREPPEPGEEWKDS